MSQGFAFGGTRARELKAKLAALTDRNQIDRFAELLSEHDASADPPWPGGVVRDCAAAMGLQPQDGNAMLQRIRQRLGPQAV